MVRKEIKLMTRRVEMCGIIASGKTTFAQAIVKAKPELCPVYENFALNPFYKDFYRNPLAFAFETELVFFLQHYHQIKLYSDITRVAICDFSLLLDMAFSKVTLSRREQIVFQKVVQEAKSHIPCSNVIIYLKCNPKTALKRIRERARPEEQSIELDYLALLDSALRKELEKAKGSVHVINIDADHVDFRNAGDADAIRETLFELDEKLGL